LRVPEVDEQIDLFSESADNIPDTVYQGLAVVKPRSAETNNETLKTPAEAQEQRRRAENATKAQKLAEQEFPGEKWQKVEDGIYLSPNRPVGEKSSYQDEKRDSEILRSFGSTVYLVPDDSRAPGKKYDAIVNGLKMEFKNMSGKSTDTLIHHFYKSRKQAPDVFINLEKSSLTKQEIINTLYGARNSPKYAEKNKFKGGRIILKINGHRNLIYLNVDGLKKKGQ
jgi:hypothetical protein